MKILKLTSEKEEYYVNIDNVAYFRKNRDKKNETVVFFNSNNGQGVTRISVLETPELIANLIGRIQDAV